MVRVKGLEPPSTMALDPKSSASTNFATPAVLYNYTYCQNKMQLIKSLV